MATLKTWAVTTELEKPVRMEGNYAHPRCDAEITTVEAHQLTIEPSGAITFWAVTNDNMQAVMLFAFAPGAWKLVQIMPPEEEKK
jgi:hypothetical protein